MSSYKITYKGMVVKEFNTVGEMDQYLADRVFEWTGLSYGHNAYMGKDYLELVNEKGTRVLLNFTPEPVSSLVLDNAFVEGHPFE